MPKDPDDPDARNLSELMMVTNVVSGHKNVIALFWENKLGVDVDVCVTSPDILPILISITYRITTVSSFSMDQNA